MGCASQGRSVYCAGSDGAGAAGGHGRDPGLYDRYCADYRGRGVHDCLSDQGCPSELLPQ